VSVLDSAAKATAALAAAVSFGDPSVLGVVVDTGTVLSAPKSTS
jgi:hypothetical protein